MNHDEGTHQSGRNTPRSSPYILRLIFLVQISNIEALGEVLTQEVGSTALESLAILHHSLNGICVQSTSETLSLRLYTL